MSRRHDPPEEMRRRWRAAERSRQRGDGNETTERKTAVREYDYRWLRLWRTTVQLAQEPPRRWSDAHMQLIADYVEARRMAHDQALIAERTPFTASANGRAYPHPAVDLARAARNEAREILADLLLTPRAMRAAEIDGDVPAEDTPAEQPPTLTVVAEPAEPVGDQVGL